MQLQFCKRLSFLLGTEGYYLPFSIVKIKRLSPSKRPSTPLGAEGLLSFPLGTEG